MFYCPRCAAEMKWPSVSRRSYRKCENCGRKSDCSNLSGTKKDGLYRDYVGGTIIENESPDKTITAWKISPTLDPSFASVVIRCYQVACDYTRNVTQFLMDSPHTKFPLYVKIDQIKITLKEYTELQSVQSDLTPLLYDVSNRGY